MTARPAVATLVALALAGCAATPPPHPILAQATPAAATTAQPASVQPASVQPAASQPSPGTQPAGGDASSDRSSRRTSRALGWVAVAIGSEAAAVALVTSVMMLHQNDIRSRECTDKVCSAAGTDANTQLSQLAPWNAAAYVVGAVGLGAGVFLLLTNKAETGTQAAVGVSPGGLTLRGSF